MKKKIYFVVEFETDGSESESRTGNKTLSVYGIETNVPKKLTDIECDVTDKSVEKIEEWLNDNGFEDEVFDFVQL